MAPEESDSSLSNEASQNSQEGSEESENTNEDSIKEDLVKDVLAFMIRVRKTFENNDQKYRDFLRLVPDFKAQRIDMAQMLSRVEDIFVDHFELLENFALFLPDKDEIFVPFLAKIDLKRREAAHSFVSKVKAHFSNDRTRLLSFLQILKEYRKKSIYELHQEASIVFYDNQDLLEEFFAKFFPDPSRKRLETRRKTA